MDIGRVEKPAAETVFSGIVRAAVARAAVQAMREPTEAMMNAGAAINIEVSVSSYCEHGGLYPDSAAKVFAAMIDAALS